MATIEERISAIAAECGVPLRDTEKEIPVSADGKETRTVRFKLPVFEGLAEDVRQPDVKLASAIAFMTAWGEGEKDYNALNKLLYSASYGFGLGVRNAITQREKPIDPEAEVKKMAERLYKAKGGKISLEQAMDRARMALE